MPLLFKAPPGLAFFNCGGIRLMLSVPEGEFKPGSSSVLYFKVTGYRGHASRPSVNAASRSSTSRISSPACRTMSCG